MFSEEASMEESCKAAAKLLALVKHEKELDEESVIKNKEYTIEPHNERVKASAKAHEKDLYLEYYLRRVSDQIKAHPEQMDTFLSDNGKRFFEGYEAFREKIRAQEKLFDNENVPVITAQPGQAKERYSLDEIRELCEKSLRDCPQIQNMSYDKDLMAAANRVTLAFLFSQGAKRMFFGKGTDWSNQEEAASQNETYRLTKKDVDYLKKTRKEIDTLYRSNGKYMSEYMKNLSGALDVMLQNAAKDPQNEDTFMVSKNEMNNLTRHSRIYYKERQGTIFNPVTDRGKARPELVENMIRKTDKILKENKAAVRGL